MKQKIYIAALLAGMLALAGCGGGGSSGGGGNPPGGGPCPLAINSVTAKG